MPFPSIHQIAHVHSYTDCAGLVKRSSQQQTSKRAGESIAQEKERTRVRNARASRQVATYPAPKKAHSLARSLAHLRLAASTHTIRSSRHQHHPFLAWRADDERAIGPTTQTPCPRSGSLLSALTSPRAPLSIHETSARARAGRRAKASCAPFPIPCVDTRSRSTPLPRRIGWLSLSPRAHARLRHPRRRCHHSPMRRTSREEQTSPVPPPPPARSPTSSKKRPRASYPPSAARRLPRRWGVNQQHRVGGGALRRACEARRASTAPPPWRERPRPSSRRALRHHRHHHQQG